MLRDDISRGAYDLDLNRFRRCSTPPPDVIMKDEEAENNAITVLRQYLYRPPVRTPPSTPSDSEEDLANSPVPRLLPSLVDDSGDEPMDVDEAPTPAASEPAFELWNVSDRKTAMPPPPVPRPKALPEPAPTPSASASSCNGKAPPPRAPNAPCPPSPKRRLTFPASPPRQGLRRPLGPRSLSLNNVIKVKADPDTAKDGAKPKKPKTFKPKPHRLRSRSFSTPAAKEAPPGTPFSKRFSLNLRFEGRRTQTLLHLVGQHLARTEQFAQLATLMLVSRPTVPQLRPLLHRIVHLTRTNLGRFLRTFVDAQPERDPRKRIKKKARRVPGIKCIVLHSVPEYAPWPAALLEDVLTAAQRLVIRCPLPGPLMQRTVALLASPEQVCLDARAIDGPSALSFALSVLPLWSELKELTVHNAGALQGSRLLSALNSRNITTPGEYRSQLASMFEQKRVVYTLDFGEDELPAGDPGSKEPGKPDTWDRFFGALNLVDAISVNIVVPHVGRRTFPGPNGANAVKHAMRAKRRGWVFGRIEDTKVRCACGQNVAKRVDLP